MSNLSEVTEALTHGKYTMEAWDFGDNEKNEPAGCAFWCRSWFNDKSLGYKLSKTIPRINAFNEIVYHIDFSGALESFWAAYGIKHKVKTAQYQVTLTLKAGK